MSKPMTDERLAWIERKFRTRYEGHEQDPYGMSVSGLDCIEEICRLQEENKQLKENQNAGWDSAIEHHEAEIAVYKDENAKLRKVVNAARPIADYCANNADLVDALRELDGCTHTPTEDHDCGRP